MINIKATKAQPKSTEPSYERYTQKAGNVLGRMPAHIALILTAVVLYLQSFVRPASADERGPGDEKPASPEPAADAPVDRADLSPAPVTAKDAQAASTDSVGATILTEAPSFVMLDSPAIDFPVAPVAVRTNNGSFEFRPRSSNDNIGVTGFSHGDPVGSSAGGSQAGHSRASSGRGESADDDEDNPADNRAPRTSGTVTFGDFATGQTAFIAFAALLQNASDPDGDVLMVTDVHAELGTIIPVQGGWLYGAPADQIGLESLTYTIRDATHSITQTARFQLVEEPAAQAAAAFTTAADFQPENDATGQDHTDALPSSSSSAVNREVARLADADAEVLYGTASDDTIYGGSGDEVVFARRGNDVVRAGAGDDRVFGEEGDDTLFGEEGDDFLSGDEGNDRLIAGPGNDVLDGGADEDEVDAGDGDDIIVGTLDAANDVYDGGEGSDTLDFSAATTGVIADLITGSVTSTEIGMDVAAGIERILTGQGDDTVIAANDTVSNHYDGGGGTDTLDLSATHLGVIVDLTTGEAVGVEIGQDEHSGFETIIGGSGDDTFMVGAQSTSLRGGDGEDDFRFSAVVLGPDQDAVNHQIQDFKIGDRIHISDHFTVTGQVAEDVKDLFEEIYGESNDDDRRPIRYRNERVDDMDRTRIEADLDGDTLYELAISLDGYHVLFIADNIA